MAEYFEAHDFSAGTLEGDNRDEHARAMLEWAIGVAQAAKASDILRRKEGRTTLRFVHQGQHYFLKLHEGVGWREILKNLSQGKRPVVDASNEYRAVAALREAGVDTLAVVAFAQSGWNPATRQSMIVSKDLTGTVSLESYCARWAAEPPPFALRIRLIRSLAEVARAMHNAGIQHRDFYLCHFHIDPLSIAQDSATCHVIDLHRAQIREPMPTAWKVKDLSALYFSAMDCGLTQRDMLRFQNYYCDGGLRAAVQIDTFWSRVAQRAQRLYRKEFGRAPVLAPRNFQASCGR